VKPRSMARWEQTRARGLKRFILIDGLLKCGSMFLILGVLSMLLAFRDANRVVRDIGWTPSLKTSDYVAIILSFSPRLLLFALVGGPLFSLLMWYSMEYIRRRAQVDSRRA